MTGQSGGVFCSTANSILTGVASINSSVGDLLHEVDDTIDAPPSPRWLPSFAKLVISCGWGVDPSLMSRLSYFCSRSSEFIPGSGSELQFENALHDLV